MRVTGKASSTFGGFWDRLTFVVAEAQILVAGVLMSLAVTLIWIRPAIPGVPPIFMGWMAVLLLLGPPIFGFFVWLIRKVRTRNMVAVYHINAVNDTLAKYYIEPDLWSDKQIDGANPWPVNGRDAWAVREFEHDEKMDEIRVRGVWLEECSDDKIWTEKSHAHAVYDTLIKSHISLKIMRNSVSELGADIQGRLTNRMAEARERGKMMDKSAVKEVFEDFEERIEDTGPDDLPTIEGEEMDGEPVDNDQGADDFEPTLDDAMQQAEQAAATDGGADGR